MSPKKHLYNSYLRKLPIAHGEVSVMSFSITAVQKDSVGRVSGNTPIYYAGVTLNPTKRMLVSKLMLRIHLDRGN